MGTGDCVCFICGSEFEFRGISQHHRECFGMRMDVGDGGAPDPPAMALPAVNREALGQDQVEAVLRYNQAARAIAAASRPFCRRCRLPIIFTELEQHLKECVEAPQGAQGAARRWGAEDSAGSGEVVVCHSCGSEFQLEVAREHIGRCEGEKRSKYARLPAALRPPAPPPFRPTVPVPGPGSSGADVDDYNRQAQRHFEMSSQVTCAICSKPVPLMAMGTHLLTCRAQGGAAAPSPYNPRRSGGVEDDREEPPQASNSNLPRVLQASPVRAIHPATFTFGDADSLLGHQIGQHGMPSLLCFLCGNHHPARSLVGHMTTCVSDHQRLLGSLPGELVAALLSQEDVHEVQLIPAMDIEEFWEEEAAVYNEAALVRYQTRFIKCPGCSRRFHLPRLVSHFPSCAREHDKTVRSKKKATKADIPPSIWQPRLPEVAKALTIHPRQVNNLFLQQQQQEQLQQQQQQQQQPPAPRRTPLLGSLPPVMGQQPTPAGRPPVYPSLFETPAVMRTHSVGVGPSVRKPTHSTTSSSPLVTLSGYSLDGNIPSSALRRPGPAPSTLRIDTATSPFPGASRLASPTSPRGFAATETRGGAANLQTNTSTTNSMSSHSQDSNLGATFDSTSLAALERQKAVFEAEVRRIREESEMQVTKLREYAHQLEERVEQLEALSPRPGEMSPPPKSPRSSHQDPSSSLDPVVPSPKASSSSKSPSKQDPKTKSCTIL
jgi:hypothetical protein